MPVSFNEEEEEVVSQHAQKAKAQGTP